MLPCYIVMVIYGMWSRHIEWRELLFISSFFKTDQEVPFYSWYPQVILQIMLIFYIISLFPEALVRIFRHPLVFSLMAFLASIALYFTTVVALDLSGGYDRLVQYYLWNFFMGFVVFFSIQEKTSRGSSMLIPIFALGLSYLVFAHQHQWMRAIVLTAALFTLIRFREITLPRSAARFVAITSQATLVIFLTHIIFLYAFEKLQLREYREGFHLKDLAFAWTFMMAGSLSVWITFEAIGRAWRFCASEMSSATPSAGPRHVPDIAWRSSKLEPARVPGRYMLGVSEPRVSPDGD